MNRKLVFSFVLSLLALSSVHAADPEPSAIRYTLDYGGNRSGSAVTTSVGERERRYTYEFQDRGRGPKIEQRVVVGDKGVPVLMEISGVDYWKNPADERFELREGKASWRNPSEKQEGVAAPGPAFYLAMNPAPQDVELLAQALLAAPGQTLQVLPSGQARIRKVASSEAEAGGKKRKVDLYEIAGLGFAPLFLWLDENRSYFATDDGWAKVFQEGWDDALPKLREIQAAQEEKLEKEQAARLIRRPKGALVFRNARLFDPESGKVTPGTTVVISGNRIQAVGKDGEVQVPQDAEVIDAAGKTLMPGLWDMHTHLTALDGLFHMASGVTTVRDLANDTDFLLDLRRRIDAGELVGTRVIMAGFIDGPGPYAGPSKVLVSTPEEALAAVDNYAKLGYEQIKLYSSLDPKLVPAIIERSHAKGMRVSGHIPYGMTAEQAVRAGFDEVHHTNFLFLNFYEGIDTRTPARFHTVGERGPDLDLRSEPVQSFLNLLKEKGTVYDPTLVTFEGLFTRSSGEMSGAYASVADRLPTQAQRALTSGSAAPEGKEARYKQAFKAMESVVRALHEKGVPIVAGTDSLAGFSLHRELELYVEAGIPAVDALRSATIVPARVMKKDKELGTIAPGKLADVILVDGDPTADIRNIRRVVLTVKDGTVYDPAKLWSEVGVKPAV
ncbi:MAG TPA: amidohydrolase family protein [Thermoanaerobaculia bacterium]|nr:amidohydrolase family protein [Thermoanaerobaculia bacterium]